MKYHNKKMDLIIGLLKAAPDGTTTEATFKFYKRGFLLSKKILLNFLTSCTVRFGCKVKFLKNRCTWKSCVGLFLVKVTLSK